jgi:hypothetical protein
VEEFIGNHAGKDHADGRGLGAHGLHDFLTVGDDIFIAHLRHGGRRNRRRQNQSTHATQEPHRSLLCLYFYDREFKVAE